ncbi:glutamine-hydrolyzing carbamoyl-phosphate synthase small subunit [Rickettsiales bacterium]|nr:glutamine-hydrolyzing carbamoyl-phosphate synthase small subunit [Rickettsiales bacterium]
METKVPEHASAALVFANGDVIFGNGVGAKGTTIGEICFNTGITGYQEILTDPSYAGQVITFTFPHIGNVGTNDEDIESTKPVAKGLIIREPITEPSNFRNQLNLEDWLVKNNITGISGVDTRAITRHTRQHGPQNVAICHFANKKDFDLTKIQEKLSKYPSLKGMELANSVTAAKSYSWNQKCWSLNDGHTNIAKTKYKVVAIDYGAKLNILRCLAELECEVIVVPAKTKAEEILKHKPDGIFLSNGPGDPAATGEYAIPVIKELLEKKIPIFGICLGHQLLSLALGCDTTKMHQGHRGSNHPVKDNETGRVEITSQNHGFVVTAESLGDDIEITHTSLFDGTIEGIKSKIYPAFSVQHHPESSPGPHDSFYLFERFMEMIRVKKPEFSSQKSEFSKKKK